MTDDEWEQRRNRAILAAFQTGRPVIADSDDVMHYADGDHETLADDVGVPKTALPRVTALAVRAERASHFAFVTSAIAAVANTICGLLWYPWQLVAAVALAGSAIVWWRINRHQRALSRGKP